MFGVSWFLIDELSRMSRNTIEKADRRQEPAHFESEVRTRKKATMASSA